MCSKGPHPIKWELTGQQVYRVVRPYSVILAEPRVWVPECCDSQGLMGKYSLQAHPSPDESCLAGRESPKHFKQ